MANRLNLTLPDALNQFVEMNSGEDTAFVNGPDHVRHCLREKQEQMIAKHTDEVYQFHLAALEGLEHTIEGKQGIIVDEMEDRLLLDL